VKRVAGMVCRTVHGRKRRQQCARTQNGAMRTAGRYPRYETQASRNQQKRCGVKRQAVAGTQAGRTAESAERQADPENGKTVAQ